MQTQTEIQQAIPHALDTTDLDGFGEKIQGRVRDIYRVDDERRLLISTDRISAFDRVLGLVPYKGQVLNQMAAWWFEQTSDIVANHLIAVPDPNVMLVREAHILPVAVVVRGYITGVTSTSLWTLYNEGVERPYGLDLPPGLKKNDRLPEPMITPTMRVEHGHHDQPLTSDEAVERGLVEPELWEEMRRVAVALFQRGQSMAMRGGLVLVDSKYEFGLIDGKLALIDEMHTPDSSRYWVAQSYGLAHREGLDPENFDKEFLRIWYAARGYFNDDDIPPMPERLVAQVAERYIAAYELLTQETFEPGELPAAERIAAHVVAYLYAGR